MKQKQTKKGDIFGGRPGSGAHRINMALINGMQGTSTEIARTVEQPSRNVSAQLSWLRSKGLVVRKKKGRRFIYRARQSVLEKAE